jgi:hypothetical protein
MSNLFDRPTRFSLHTLSQPLDSCIRIVTAMGGMLDIEALLDSWFQHVDHPEKED